MNKKLLTIHKDADEHWVGDGFPVKTIFSYQTLGREMSPFLLLDYAAPAQFQPAKKQRGVGEHPHRGFETVTIVYQGALAHRDSGGNHGKLAAGDVQWMTAASGVVHEELHTQEFTQSGGTMEMVQLWVNLPAKLKMSSPRYQDISSSRIPTVPLPDRDGSVRIIAGEYKGTKGPAKTFTPINLWDIKLNKGYAWNLSLPAGYTTAFFLLKGEIVVNDFTTVKPTELALLDREGEQISVQANEDSIVLLLNGEPIQEPIAGYGPFVMNTEQQIREAVADYSSGRMGHLPS